MIVSHKFQMIFIKTQKTAGSSIERWLADHLGERDIKVGSGDGTDKLNTSPADAHWGESHLPWTYVRDHWTREWEQYFTWCVERNPWDKMVSWWWWHQSRNLERVRDKSFKQWVMGPQPSQLDDWCRYADTLTNEVQVDRVVRFEDLPSALSTLNLPYSGELEEYRIHTNSRPEGHYSLYYDAESKEWIEQIYERVIQRFNYSFHVPESKVE